MEQPLGYVIQGENKDCHLRKAIYGHKQSPWAWFEKFSITIYGIGFHRYHSDHSVFIRRTNSGLVILAAYVDDILLIGSDSTELVETNKYLRCYFVIKDMCKPKYFMGIEIAHKKQCTFSQRKYALDLLEKKQLLEYKPDSTLMKTNVDMV